MSPLKLNIETAGPKKEIPGRCRGQRRWALLRMLASGRACFDMTSQPQEIGDGNNLAARPLEVEFAVVLSRIIDSIEHNPAQLRNAVYELARIKLRREAWRENPAINPPEARRLTLALESAIEGVEAIYSKHDEPKGLQSLDRLIESSKISRSEVMIETREPLLIINEAPTQIADADHRSVFFSRAKDTSLNVKRLLQWPGAAPLLRGALVAIFALVLCAVFSQFGLLGRQAPLSLSQPESAPTIRAATARPHDAPVAHSQPRRVVAAGSPAVALGDAPRDRGDHEPLTGRPDEQSLKPPRSSCSTQTYKVPSEGGGEASINVVRCHGQ